MKVKYSPKIARWIAEREGVELDADGSLTIEHPLADQEWGVRHVLQYGPDASCWTRGKCGTQSHAGSSRFVAETRSILLSQYVDLLIIIDSKHFQHVAIYGSL
jgi:hypothetical protein